MARKTKSYPELDKLAHLLGTMPDADVAVKAKTSASIVGRYRRTRKIKAYQGYKFGFDAEVAAPPAAAPAPAKKAKAVKKAKKAAPAKSVAAKPKTFRKSKISPFRSEVGKIPDRQLAQKAGVTTESVRMYRRRHGIELTLPAAPNARPTPESKVPRRRRSKLDPYADLLGTVPDGEVAAMAGVTSENVRAYRRRHSIPTQWRELRRAGGRPAAAPVAAAPAPAAAAPVAAPAAPVAAASAPVVAKVAGTVQAYAIAVAGSDVEYFIVAANIAAAATAALAALPGVAGTDQITGIRHLGPAIG
jgi:hypothetical protein